MPYLKFENIAAFEIWHNKIMEKLGIPDDKGTTQYSKALIHPINNSVVAIADERGYTETDILIEINDLYDLGYLERPVFPYL